MTIAIPKNSIIPLRPHRPPTATSNTVSPTISAIVLMVFIDPTPPVEMTSDKYRSTQGLRQQLHRMHNLQVEACAAGAISELEHTTGVTGGEDVEACLAYLFH